MFGNGISGLTVNVLRAIMISALPGSDTGVYIYFALACGILIICGLAQFWVMH